MQDEFGDAIFNAIRNTYYMDGNMLNIISQYTVSDFAELTFLESVEDYTYVCSPSGEILLFDFRGFYFGIDWDVTLYQIQIAVDGREVPPVPRHFTRMFGLVSESYKELVNWPTNGRTFQQQGAETRYDYFHQQLPLFFERHNWTVSLAIFDYIELLQQYGVKVGYKSIDNYADIEELLRPFEGWSLCVQEKFVQNLWAKRIKEDRFNTDRKNISSGRRPTIRQDTAKAYRLLFPKGHGDAPFNSVLAQVNKISGHDASADTLRRAMGDLADHKNDTA